MRVDIEKIRALVAELRDFNRLNLREIEFFENGGEINIPESLLVEFEYTGLSNKDFIDFLDEYRDMLAAGSRKQP